MKKLIYDIYRQIKFFIKLNKLKVFSNRNPLNILTVLEEFLLSESKVYNSSDRILYRTHEQNAQLFSNLVKTYINTKSKTTYEQIFEILKMTVAKGD